MALCGEGHALTRHRSAELTARCAPGNDATKVGKRLVIGMCGQECARPGSCLEMDRILTMTDVPLLCAGDIYLPLAAPNAGGCYCIGLFEIDMSDPIGSKCLVLATSTPFPVCAAVVAGEDDITASASSCAALIEDMRSLNCLNIVLWPDRSKAGDMEDTAINYVRIRLPEPSVAGQWQLSVGFQIVSKSGRLPAVSQKAILQFPTNFALSSSMATAVGSVQWPEGRIHIRLPYHDRAQSEDLGLDGALLHLTSTSRSAVGTGEATFHVSCRYCSQGIVRPLSDATLFPSGRFEEARSCCYAFDITFNDIHFRILMNSCAASTQSVRCLRSIYCLARGKCALPTIPSQCTPPI